MPKLGKAGSLQSRQAIVHSLVHTESWAIDLSWDIIARFGKQEAMPREFFTDFVKVAQDEGRHFTLLVARLEELGSFYGSLPAHDGLWDSAVATSNNLLARLAIEHCVHEVTILSNLFALRSVSINGSMVTMFELIKAQARGLDVLPTTISRFRKGGDVKTADLLETVVYPEEITHCAAGVKWFKYLCLRSRNPPLSALDVHCLGSRDRETHERESMADCEGASEEERTTMAGGGGGGDDEIEAVIGTFHATVRKYFRGPLKPPFNEHARKAAGFGPRWYEPLAVKEASPEQE